jgi:hypothetical protein
MLMFSDDGTKLGQAYLKKTTPPDGEALQYIT